MKRKSIAGIVKEEKVIMNKDAASGFTFRRFQIQVVDAMIKYDLARFGMPGSSVGVNVNNLFDREYVSSCYRDYACYWGAERQVVATATFRF